MPNVKSTYIVVSRPRYNAVPPALNAQKELVGPRWTLASEVEQVKKVANGRPVCWNISADHRVVRRVWQVIAAAAGDRRQAPVVFDELQNRNMVRIVVGNVAWPGVRRNHNQRNARAIAEEIERLHISRVVIAAAFVYSHENCSSAPESGIRLDHVHDLLDEPFKQVPFR